MEAISALRRVATKTSFTSSKGLNANQSRTITSYASLKPGKKRVTLLPGDGIGKEISDSVVGVFQAANVPLDFERFDYSWTALSDGSLAYKEVLASLARNRVGLKGAYFTPLIGGPVSRNVQIRKDLDIFANVVPLKNFEGVTTRHSNSKIDIVVVRENTQGEYSGFEQEVEPGVVQSLKIVTELASRRICEYAFQLAASEGRKKVTAVHKANIQKATDGLFLETFRQVAQKYPSIKSDDIIIDNCCMQLVMRPSQFDVMVTTNLYGNIVTNVAGGLIGGPGVVGGANMGEGIALFEPGTRHVALDIAGKNKANPVAMLLSSTMMLRHLELPEHANLIESAIHEVVKEGKFLTADLGGQSTTTDVTSAIIEKILNPPITGVNL